MWLPQRRSSNLASVLSEQEQETIILASHYQIVMGRADVVVKNLVFDLIIIIIIIIIINYVRPELTPQSTIDRGPFEERVQTSNLPLSSLIHRRLKNQNFQLNQEQLSVQVLSPGLKAARGTSGMNIQFCTLNRFFSLPPNTQRNLSLVFSPDASISKIRRLHSAMVISTTHRVNSGSHY